MIAPPVRARPARVPQLLISRATPGSSFRRGPAPTSSCRMASMVRSSQSDPAASTVQIGRKRRSTMNAANEPTAAASMPLHFPHPIDGLAGTSFKHEHLPAILAQGAQRGFFEVHAENYMGAGGAPHR